MNLRSCRVWVVVGALGLLAGCRGEECQVCAKPVDSLVGFPRVEAEAGTSRVVSTLHVGEKVYVCIFADCGCSPIYDVEWQSSDASVAVVTTPGVPLTVCNDAFDHAPTGEAQAAGELKGLSPGETRIIAVATERGSRRPLGAAFPMHCASFNRACSSIDVVRVVP